MSDSEEKICRDCASWKPKPDATFGNCPVHAKRLGKPDFICGCGYTCDEWQKKAKEQGGDPVNVRIPF